MPEWFEDLETLHDEIWRRLERGVADRHAPARHPVLATEAIGGGGEARIVVLRAVSAEDAVLEMHTDTATAKVGELAREPRVTLLVWEDRARLQIRLRARVEIVKSAGAERAWARVPETARQIYGGSHPPGAPLKDAEDFIPFADPARFAVLTARAYEIDALHLGQNHHRRALFQASDNWRGSWIAP